MTGAEDFEVQTPAKLTERSLVESSIMRNTTNNSRHGITTHRVFGTRRRQQRAANLLIAFAVFFAAANMSAQSSPRSASLSGTVFTDSGDVPIADAEILFPSLKLSARSDSKGNFQITGVPAGSYELIVRQVGYEAYAATMTFRIGQKIEADFMLKLLTTTLAKVNVNAAADPRYATRLKDFEDRRRYGSGRFLTSDIFRNAVGQNLSQVLVSRIPGIRTVGNGSHQTLVASRGAGCSVQVIVNGIVQYNGRPGEAKFDINSIYASDILGLEYYTLATTPAQFMGTGASACGTVVVWTK